MCARTAEVNALLQAPPRAIPANPIALSWRLRPRIAVSRSYFYSASPFPRANHFIFVSSLSI